MNDELFIDGSFEETNIANRRRQIRRKVSWTVEGIWQNRRTFTACTIDVSDSGILMHTAREFKKGDKAYIKISIFTHGDHRVIDAIIEVRYSSISQNLYSCGVLFVKMSVQDRLFLKSYLTGKNPHLSVTELSNTKSSLHHIEVLN